MEKEIQEKKRTVGNLLVIFQRIFTEHDLDLDLDLALDLYLALALDLALDLFVVDELRFVGILREQVQDSG